MQPVDALIDSIILTANTCSTGIIVGIDGLGGAGKSTLSEALLDRLQTQGYHTILLHIDDFINVKKIRYNPVCPEWQCYYDLQWRFSYFLHVINQIRAHHKDHIDIERYDKENDTYFVQRHPLQANTIVIVEGIFLQKKEYRNVFDYMIYLDIPEAVRLQRVLKRDTYIGSEQQIVDKYVKRYLPAERKYIEEYHPCRHADFVISD